MFSKQEYVLGADLTGRVPSHFMKPAEAKNHELREPHALTRCIANTDNCAEYGNQVVLMKTNKLCDFLGGVLPLRKSSHAVIQ